jgi:hypothetical protein
MSTKRPTRIALGSVLSIASALYALGCGDSHSAGGDAGGSPGSGANGGASSGANGGSTNAGGAGAGGGMNVESNSCEIDLQTFEQNGYRTCEPNDSAAVAGICGPEFAFEHGRTEVCGNFRLYAYGHDGRITCAYDSSTGTLVGGLLQGLPVQDTSCSSAAHLYFAGPAELASCPVPTIPYCDNTDSGTGGGAGGTSAGEGGAVDISTEAGAGGAR